jgi:transposase
MKKTDARKLKHEQLTELRKRGVAAVNNGATPSEVARILGVTRAAVYGWLARLQQGGEGALEARKRGGRKPKLNGKAIAWLYQAITLGDPRQYRFEFALWTSKMVAELIWRRFDVRLSKASTCRLLNRLGLSPQRPLWRAYQQDPHVVEKWLREDFPRIQALAKAKKARIWFGDEAGLRSDAHAGTTWARKGKTPVVSTTGTRFGMNLFSAVNRQGEFRFMGVKGRINAGEFIEFLKRLVCGASHPVFLIVDGHPTHKAAKVERHVKTTNGRLQLFYLPPYAPELNPDELVWNDLKNNGIGRKSIVDLKQLRRDATSHLRSLQKMPRKIRSFFQTKTTVYAA